MCEFLWLQVFREISKHHALDTHLFGPTSLWSPTSSLPSLWLPPPCRLHSGLLRPRSVFPVLMHQFPPAFEICLRWHGLVLIFILFCFPAFMMIAEALSLSSRVDNGMPNSPIIEGLDAFSCRFLYCQEDKLVWFFYCSLFSLGGLIYYSPRKHKEVSKKINSW